MQEHTPSQDFSNLQPSPRSAALTRIPSSGSATSSGVVGNPNELGYSETHATTDPSQSCTSQDALNLILDALLPPAREETIQARERLLRCSQWESPSRELRWLLLPEVQEWTGDDWWLKSGDIRTKHQWEGLLASVLSVPMTNGPELDEWLLKHQPEKLFPVGWAGDLFYQSGHLVCTQGTLRLTEIRQDMGLRHVEEIEGTTSWIGNMVVGLMCGASAYREPEKLKELESKWPDWLDLDQIWVGSGSDLMGDHLALLQGTEAQMEAATRGFVMPKKANGLKAGLLLNSWFDQLSAIQAALLLPESLRRNILLRLP